MEVYKIDPQQQLLLDDSIFDVDISFEHTIFVHHLSSTYQ